MALALSAIHDANRYLVVDGFAISHVHLVLTALAPFADEPTFQTLATKAKQDCAVSKLLNAEITLDAKLIGRKATRGKERPMQ